MLTYLEILDVATLLVILVCLWVRRSTWRNKWEQPKTLGLALIAAGAFLKAPPVSWLIDSNVMHGLYLLVAHILIVTGIAAFAYSAERKLRPDSTMRKWHITFVVFPWTLGTATLVAVFKAGASSNLDQLFQYPVGYTTAYWLVYDAITVYFLCLWAYALGYLFWDPPSRRASAIYLIAIILSLVSAVCRVLLVSGEDDIPDNLLIGVAATANALAICVFAIGAAKLWRCRQRAVQGSTKFCYCQGSCKYLSGPEETTPVNRSVWKITHH